MSNGETSLLFRYDSDGVRTQKTVNGVTTQYTTVGGTITGQSDGTATMQFMYDESGAPFALLVNGTAYLYITNAQGDVVMLADENGAPVCEYEYDAWGNLIAMTGSDVITGGLNPIRYRGYYYDTETGLYYLQSRYYDPTTMRFINADDPNIIQMGAKGRQELNLYAYCTNDPVNMVDPTGYDAIWINAYSAAMTFGHSSLLIESYPNTWYYFFWGPKNMGYAVLSASGVSVPQKVIYRHETNLGISKSSSYLNLNSLNNRLKNRDSGLNIAGGERYTSYVYIKGDFTALRSYIITYMQGKNAPKYTLYHCNCAYMSVKALLRGKLTYDQRQGLNDLLNGGTLIPNNVIGEISRIFRRVIRYR